MQNLYLNIILFRYLFLWLFLLLAYLLDDEDEEPAEETEASPEEVLQYAWETVCYVIWGKASAKGGQKVLETAPGELKELYEQVFLQL